MRLTAILEAVGGGISSRPAQMLRANKGGAKLTRQDICAAPGLPFSSATAEASELTICNDVHATRTERADFQAPRPLRKEVCQFTCPVIVPRVVFLAAPIYMESDFPLWGEYLSRF